MKITKTSLMLLKKHGRLLNNNREIRKEYDNRINLISEILMRAEVICGDTKDGFTVYNANNRSICLVGESEKPTLRGMASRYGCIECTFTNGLNQVEITDADRLIKAVASEI